MEWRELICRLLFIFLGLFYTTVKWSGAVIESDPIKFWIFYIDTSSWRTLIATTQTYLGRSPDVDETEGMSTPTEERGDLLIRYLWKHQTDCILDMRIPSNIHWNRKQSFFPMSAENRRNTPKPAWDQRSHFSPFVISCDGVLGNKAKGVLQNLAGSRAKKSGKS